MRLTGKTILVTGGSSGLGAATTRALVAAGATVLIADVTDDAGRALADRLGDAAVFVHTDVTSADSVIAAITTATAHFGGLSGAINCAGISESARVLSKASVHSLELFQRVVAINLVGTFNVIRLAADAIARQRPSAAGERGVIINTASIAAFEGQIGQAAYSASKGGIHAMTLPIARELAHVGIRVVTIAPGIFDTPMLAALPLAVRNALGAEVPFPSRLGHPEEYAALVVHVIANEMLNGETIRLDGALRMGPR